MLHYLLVKSCTWQMLGIPGIYIVYYIQYIQVDYLLMNTYNEKPDAIVPVILSPPFSSHFISFPLVLSYNFLLSLLLLSLLHSSIHRFLPFSFSLQFSIAPLQLLHFSFIYCFHCSERSFPRKANWFPCHMTTPLRQTDRDYN